jgi:hypothetical protein
MAGCYGNSKEDQYRERQLDKWLETQSDNPFDEDEFDRKCAETDEHYDQLRLEKYENLQRQSN